jgi:hypothetical protein
MLAGHTALSVLSMPPTAPPTNLTIR